MVGWWTKWPQLSWTCCCWWCHLHWQLTWWFMGTITVPSESEIKGKNKTQRHCHSITVASMLLHFLLPAPWYQTFLLSDLYRPDVIWSPLLWYDLVHSWSLEPSSMSTRSLRSHSGHPKTRWNSPCRLTCVWSCPSPSPSLLLTATSPHSCGPTKVAGEETQL